LRSRRHCAGRCSLNKTSAIAAAEPVVLGEIAGFNRPTNVRFGPDGCACVSDYGAIRDVGQSDPDTKYKVAADGILVQIPGTGVIWKICPN
jgi:hypothetical protein